MGLLNKTYIVAMVALMFSATIAYSQTGYGTSSILLTSKGASVLQGQSANVSYTVMLASGGTWGTTLQVQNQASLSSQGINVGISSPSGDPPYGGTAMISTSSSTPPGSYNVTFVATGDDPSASPSTFVLSVTAVQQTTTVVAGSLTNHNQTTNSTTILSSTVQPTTTTAYSTTIQYNANQQQGSLPLYVSVLAVVVTIVVIAAAFKFA